MAPKPKSSRDHNLDGYRADYKGGDKSALASAIHYCAVAGKPLPEWVADAWHEGRANVLMRLCDWNDVLGRVRRKTPKRIRREARTDELLTRMARLLPGVQSPIERDSEGAFRELAEKMGITPRQARELYYEKYTYKGKQHSVFGSYVLRRRGRGSKVSRN